MCTFSHSNSVITSLVGIPSQWFPLISNWCSFVLFKLLENSNFKKPNTALDHVKLTAIIISQRIQFVICRLFEIEVITYGGQGTTKMHRSIIFQYWYQPPQSYMTDWQLMSLDRTFDLNDVLCVIPPISGDCYLAVVAHTLKNRTPSKAFHFN